MAKTRSKNHGKLASISKNHKPVKKRGPSSSGDVKKTKSMDAVLGIEPIDFTDEEDDAHEPDFEQHQVLSPRSSLRELQRHDDVRKDFNHFLEVNHSCRREVMTGNSPVPPILRSGSVIRSLDHSFQETSIEKQNPDNEKTIVKITMEDIEGEIEYWNSAIVCYVLGANPPLDVLEGFARRIWKEKVDKVGLISYGIFLIRFTSVEIRDSILNGGYTFFNKRPVIMKSWDPDTNFRKGDIHKVPIWIQLENLELKYWGQNTLYKIIGQIGEPIMVDEVTKMRQKLSFPRILVEVSMEQDLPSAISFEDEHGYVTSIGIKYEWKPIICKNCNGLGHSTDECRRKPSAPQQQWIVKNKRAELKEDNVVRPGTDTAGYTPAKTTSGVCLSVPSDGEQPVTFAEILKGKKPVVRGDQDGFQQVHKGLKTHDTDLAESTNTRNSYSVLQEPESKDGDSLEMLTPNRDKTKGGGVPSKPNG
uniref:DUF4283 domain-containing protein n=1 Tax=Cannabis sativa TaxID=3483 RepID=A0A803PT20_CANSA